MPIPLNGEEWFFNRWCWDNKIATGKQTKKKVNTYFIPHTKINSEWIIDPNVKENRRKPRTESLLAVARQWFLRYDTESTSSNSKKQIHWTSLLLGM